MKGKEGNKGTKVNLNNRYQHFELKLKIVEGSMSFYILINIIIITRLSHAEELIIELLLNSTFLYSAQII